jgi:CheY-like chemotaxis protein
MTEPTSQAPPRRKVLGFQDLMHRRVGRILLVSSPYDHFILAEDGQLTERVLSEFLDVGLRNTPDLLRVSTGAEALAAAGGEWPHDLVIATLHVGDMNAVELAQKLRAAGLDTPVVLLAYDARELSDFAARNDMSQIERTFLWQGGVRILLAIAKYIEDKLNLAHDFAAGVPLILIVEDSVRYYSSFLPMIYTELFRNSRALLAEGLNLSHKILRMRARPKLVLASTFEDAWATFTTYMDGVLGVISDIEFARGGGSTRLAGVDLAMRIREAAPDMPIVLQSSRPENAALANQVGATFLLKGSPLLLNDLRRCLLDEFSFGDFVFRLPDRREVGRARDLRTLEEQLRVVPAESLAYHGERNQFSKWLRARTEFALAHRLRPRRLSDYPDLEALRRDLIDSIAEYRRELNLGIVADFNRGTFDGEGDFYRVGGGSLGGKARGLAFMRRLLAESRLAARVPGVRVGVPACVVVGTDVFDQFLDENHLRDFAIGTSDDAELRRRITEAPFPVETRQDLAAFLARTHDPLAVRSSSLLEDSQYQPFTGVYETYMLPNNHADLEVRLEQLVRAIKGVYASTFSQHAKAYLRATPYRLEEEKMAVILQRVVGADRGGRFYPDFSGVARSVNFYPAPPIAPEDGIAAVALGLGRAVVEGGNCLRFCPRYPHHLVQFSSVEDVLENSQREFWALELLEGHAGMDPHAEMREASFGLEVAEADGTLAAVASTYSSEDDAVFDGLSRPGVRLVSFAPVLKHGVFPLPAILDELLRVGSEGMCLPVEIEFAVTLSQPPEFGFLQMRPLALSHELEELDLGEIRAQDMLCHASSVLGNGHIEGLRDLVVVDYDRFDRARSRDAAQEVAQMNSELVSARTPYVLVGVGRWGSADPWLGVPVTWDQISGARVIVESGFKDLKVAPSQGTHFFQNLTSFQVGYFTVNPDVGDGFVDWAWLAAQPAVREGTFVRHIRLPAPVDVRMNGRKREGVIKKPGPMATRPVRGLRVTPVFGIEVEKP